MLATKTARVGIRLKQTPLHLQTGLLSLQLIFPHQISRLCCNGRSAGWINDLSFRTPHDFSPFVLDTVLIYESQCWFHRLQFAGRAGCDPWGQRYCWTCAIVSGTFRQAMCSCARLGAGGPLTLTVLPDCHSTCQSCWVLLCQHEHMWVRGCRRESCASSCVSINVSHFLRLPHAVQWE